jgi:DNA-binding MarR family transcriptional regulator
MLRQLRPKNAIEMHTTKEQTMGDYPQYDLDPVTQEVFDLLRRQPGDVFSPDAIAEQVGYGGPDIAPALRQLLDLGFVEHAPGDQERYILSPSAPEL